MKVSLTGQLCIAAGDLTEISIEAGTIGELLARLIERYPLMNIQMDRGIAVSINGEIFRDRWDEVIPADAEVFLMPRIAGG